MARRFECRRSGHAKLDLNESISRRADAIFYFHAPADAASFLYSRHYYFNLIYSFVSHTDLYLKTGQFSVPKPFSGTPGLSTEKRGGPVQNGTYGHFYHPLSLTGPLPRLDIQIGPNSC
ncbi:hypothetical protein EVAR_54626_1 [Eumeta japonica]|uniref:Uncharacterized protein n=1 Tax=Eumeta variegata TaxID=151549 RepID=A0A4C1X8H5_EUMVA|nr:hypothetical protein EVAR_54626_1 [Eumeta japonica]